VTDRSPSWRTLFPFPPVLFFFHSRSRATACRGLLTVPRLPSSPLFFNFSPWYEEDSFLETCPFPTDIERILLSPNDAKIRASLFLPLDRPPLTRAMRVGALSLLDLFKGPVLKSPPFSHPQKRNRLLPFPLLFPPRSHHPFSFHL